MKNLKKKDVKIIPFIKLIYRHHSTIIQQAPHTNQARSFLKQKYTLDGLGISPFIRKTHQKKICENKKKTLKDNKNVIASCY